MCTKQLGAHARVHLHEHTISFFLTNYNLRACLQEEEKNNNKQKSSSRVEQLNLSKKKYILNNFKQFQIRCLNAAKVTKLLFENCIFEISHSYGLQQAAV